MSLGPEVVYVTRHRHSDSSSRNSYRVGQQTPSIVGRLDKHNAKHVWRISIFKVISTAEGESGAYARDRWWTKQVSFLYSEEGWPPVWRDDLDNFDGSRALAVSWTGWPPV
jgi:hypothetical protein